MEPADNRDPLFPPPNETTDLPLPNLTPRHQELIPTPCGPLCFCVLLLMSLREITLLHGIILATGIFWACLKVTVGIIAILKELKPVVWIFLTQNIPEVANLVYLLYMVIRDWGKGSSYALEAAVIIGSCISVAIKSVLFWALFHVYRSFGQGLRERMFSSYGRIDS